MDPNFTFDDDAVKPLVIDLNDYSAPISNDTQDCADFFALQVARRFTVDVYPLELKEEWRLGWLFQITIPTTTVAEVKEYAQAIQSDLFWMRSIFVPFKVIGYTDVSVED